METSRPDWWPCYWALEKWRDEWPEQSSDTRCPGGGTMKFKTVVLIASILIASISACAKVIPPRPFFLDRDVTLNGAEVSHGMYTLTLESQGASVRATLWREGQFIATARGTWVKHS